MSQREPGFERRTVSEPRSPDRALTRYDVVLAAVPFALVLGALCGVLAGVGLRSGVVAGGSLALCVVCYGVFGDPPTRRDGGGGETAL